MALGLRYVRIVSNAARAQEHSRGSAALSESLPESTFGDRATAKIPTEAMDPMDPTDATEPNRRINHVEMVYRPGERALAAEFFTLLGMRVADRGGRWFTVFADPESTDGSNNACYASEVTPGQWALEEALAAAAGGADPLGVAARGYRDQLVAEPQTSFHFGVRYRDRADFDATLERVRHAATDGPLAGRVGLAGVFDPAAPGALAPNMVQAFVRTDVVAAGLLAFGQHVELQWHLPA